MKEIIIIFDVHSYRFAFTGGEIARVICKAGEVCASLSSRDEQAKINQDMLLTAADSETKRKQLNSTFVPSMYE